eukprot:1144483-Pelagomonas_calceolata.AAC.1
MRFASKGLLTHYALSQGCDQLDDALHMLSGCQNHITSNIKTERHNVAGRMMIKALSKSPLGAGLINTGIGSDDRLAQNNLQLPPHASNRVLNHINRPDAILITPHQAIPTSSSPHSPCSQRVLRSRHGTPQRSSVANGVRQPHQLDANQ